MRIPQHRLRTQISEVLRSDADLDAFCSDHFPDISRRFSDGMQRVRKVTILLEHADHDRLADLLTFGGAPCDAACEPEPHASEASAGPVRVLFVAANPHLTTALDLARELRLIEDRIRRSRHREALELVSRWAIRPDDLQQALLEEQPHVLHFSGHGSTDEQIVLEDDGGNVATVDIDAFAELVGILKDNLRLVVLNACFSERLADALTRHVDFAIGMREPMRNLAAIEFSASFYRAIGFGRSIDEAFLLGCSALKLRKVPGEGAPQLKVKPGADATKLFLLRPPERGR